VIRTLRTAVAAALLLAAGNAWALGLGQIQVKSKRNQPLLAEIPIVSTTPGELAALRARLASPDTFRRVGLAPPTGIASDLQFSLGSDSKGRPVIRVTTLRPVEQAELNFLIEVDWGAGRLVREYSALVDAPNTAGAVLPPDVQAPQTPAPTVVQRPAPLPEPRPPVAAAPAAFQPPAKPIAPPSPAPAPASAESAAPSIAIAPLPATRPAYVPAPAPAASADPAEYGPVKRGESLSKIASGLGLRREFSLDQTMLALLQANPDAFLGDDVNRLRSGAVLRVPSREDVARIAPEEAAQVVRQQMRQWRQSRRAVRQPDAAPAVARAAAPAKPAASKPATAPAAASAAAKPTATPAAAAPRQEARLQIVPPSGPGKATGNKSGTSAGGEGSMLQQELRQRDEDIAAKSAEIGELKERLAALEKLKEDQQKLIALKDSELAAAQARLAEANRGTQAAVPAPAAAKAATQAAPAPEAGGSSMPWIWGGLGVVVLALGAWLLAGRRRPAPPVRRSVFDSEALAASMAAPAMGAANSAQDMHEADAVDADADREADAEAPAPVAGDADSVMPAASVEEVPVAATAAESPAADDHAAAPAWHRPEAPVADPAPAAVVAEAAPAAAPVVALDDLPAPADVPVQASAEQRFKLARAFLDVGDENSAQQLLLELLDDDDQTVSDEAARMLSKLVG